MFPRWSLRVALVLVVSGVSGLTISATNNTAAPTSDVDIALPSANTIEVFSSLQPLTSGADDLPTYGISDTLKHVTANNQQELAENNIAYMSCDSIDYPGFTSLNNVFQTALAANATAIILYSLQSTQCNISGTESAYNYIYSMPNQTMAQNLLDQINDHPPFSATIIHSNSNRLNSGSGNDNGSNNNNNGHQRPSYGTAPTTAVAMIILYSVTGIITALFLIIIITGAVRAHRHPERYGPRNSAGRPRQSRARGIARAMLDTIPIVKFGEQTPDQEAKTTDVEMADTTDAKAPRSSVTHDGTRDIESVDQAAPPRQSMASVRSGIGAATTNPTTTSGPKTSNLPSEALGCSICTDDFEAGQDLRVLPCDHKFHPDCIDPWLLNVSSTCPLCRVDLRPADSDAGAENQDTNGNGELPPPMNGYGGAHRISMRRSLLIGLGLDRGNNVEQRVAAARELSEQQQQNDGEQTEDAPQRRRLRERFGIRTRRRGQSDAVAPTPTTTNDTIVEGSSSAEGVGAAEQSETSRPNNTSS